MAEYHPHTVLRELHHLAEPEHEHLDEMGFSLGLRPNAHPPGVYQPGQTVHLTQEQAADLIASGHVAPPGASVRYEMRLTSEL